MNGRKCLSTLIKLITFVKMKRLLKTFFLIALALEIITSCSLQKRVYRNGYHIVWNAKYKQGNQKLENRTIEKAIVKSEILPVKESVLATANRDIEIASLKRKPVLILSNDTCGDVLLLQNADELQVKILEIDEQTIRYKRCDNLNGPTFSISKNRVALIKYANGTKEVIMPEPPAKTVIQRNVNAPEMPRKVNIMGLASLLLYILGTILSSGLNAAGLSGSMLILLALLSIAPLVMAYISLFQFKREPNKYKGRWMPITVVCIYLAFILILTLLLATVGAILGGGVGAIVVFLLVLFLLFLGILIAALIPKADPKTNVK